MRLLSRSCHPDEQREEGSSLDSLVLKKRFFTTFRMTEFVQRPTSNPNSTPQPLFPYPQKHAL